MYSITYQTKRGGSGVQTSSGLDEIKKKAIWLMRQKLPATIYHDGKEAGKVFEDNSCRIGWNYSIDLDV